MDKKDLIERTFDGINERFDFVTLRNFELIPHDSSRANDIDIIIRKGDKEEYSKYMTSLGYSLSYDSESYIYEAESHIHCVNPSLDVHFDTVTGLYYRSLSDMNLFVGGFKELEDSLFDNKLSVNKCYKYIPSPEDLLTHLCCHCIFDKRNVPQKYQNSINNLFLDCNEPKLDSLFKLAFHKASSYLISLIKEGEVGSLYLKYIGYQDY